MAVFINLLGWAGYGAHPSVAVNGVWIVIGVYAMTSARRRSGARA